jgi:hypothetical protein
MTPSNAQLAAKRCAGLIKPSIGPYLEVPPLLPPDKRRLVSQLAEVGGLNPGAAVADALNVVTRVSADHAETMRVSEWQGLLPSLVTLVANGVRWRDAYGGRLAARLAGGSGGSGGGGGAGGGKEEGGVVWEAPATAMGGGVTAGYSITTTTTTTAATTTSDASDAQVAGSAARVEQSAGAGPRTLPELEEATKRRREKGSDEATKRRRIGGIDDVSLWAEVDDMAGTEEEERADAMVGLYKLNSVDR